MEKLKALWYTVVESLWFLPTLLTLAGSALAITLVRFDAAILQGFGGDQPWWVFGGSAGGARSVLEAMKRRLDRQPDAMTLRRRTIEHVFGTLKHWMGSTHFLTRRLVNVSTEMSLHVLAYNLKRVINLLGMAKTMKAMRLLGA